MAERQGPESPQNFHIPNPPEIEPHYPLIDEMKSAHPIPNAFREKYNDIKDPLLEYLDRLRNTLTDSGQQRFDLATSKGKYLPFLIEAAPWMDERILEVQGPAERKRLVNGLYTKMKNNVLNGAIFEYESVRSKNTSESGREKKYLDVDNMLLAFGTMYIKGHLWGEEGIKGQTKTLPAAILLNLLPKNELSNYLAGRFKQSDQTLHRYMTEFANKKDGAEWLIRERLPEAAEDLKHVTAEKIDEAIKTLIKNHPTWFVDSGEGINPQEIPLSENALYAVKFLTGKGTRRLSQGGHTVWDTSKPEAIRSLKAVKNELIHRGENLYTLYDASRSRVIQKIHERREAGKNKSD